MVSQPHAGDRQIERHQHHGKGYHHGRKQKQKELLFTPKAILGKHIAQGGGCKERHHRYRHGSDSAIGKRRREIDRFDLEQLSTVSEGFSGAEIEQAVIASMYEAFAQDREFTQLDIIAAIKSTMPLSKTMNEQVTALRDWARQRARPAASSVAEYQRMEF